MSEHRASPEDVRLDLAGGFGVVLSPDEARRVARLLDGAGIASPRLAGLLAADAERAAKHRKAFL